MPTHLPARCCTLVSLALIATSLGCAATSPYMHSQPPSPLIRPGPNQAQVVFVRPSSFAFGLKFTILDHSGRFLGDSLPRSQFAVMVPPGRHVFIVWAENTAALRADLAPGRTYFVEVAPRMGAFSARVHLLAITPRRASWLERDAWLQATERLQSDFVAGQSYLTARGPDTMERVRRALEHLQQYDAAELADRTITPADGI